MKNTSLGRSELQVSRIAFGTWQLGGDWGRFDEDTAVKAIRRARELGVNFFDTAQAYGFGSSERLLGTALRDELAADRGLTVSQLAIAWTLANPAVHVAIVGARQAKHVEDSLAAADVSLTDADLAEIDEIMASATPVAGPSPESV